MKATFFIQSRANFDVSPSSSKIRCHDHVTRSKVGAFKLELLVISVVGVKLVWWEIWQIILYSSADLFYFSDAVTEHND